MIVERKKVRRRKNKSTYDTIDLTLLVELVSKFFKNKLILKYSWLPNWLNLMTNWLPTTKIWLDFIPEDRHQYLSEM